jgi:hypothetical protein
MENWKDQLTQRWAAISKGRKANEPSNANVNRVAPGRPIRAVEINLGIDFGTAFSKVCYRNVGTNVAGFVPFGQESQDCEPTMLPSVVWIDSQGRLYSPFDHRPDGCFESRFLKMYLAGLGIGEPYKQKTKTRVPVYYLLTAFYLAIVIRRTREKISQIDRLAMNDVKWTGNIGIPIGYWESAARPRFEEVVRVSVDLANGAMDSDTPTLAELDVAYSECVADPSPASEDFFITSELEAEICGLISDAGTRDGIYALFDIGSGTLDGTAFSLKRENGSMQVNFLTALVAPLGFDASAEMVRQTLDIRDIARSLRERSMNVKFDLAPLQNSLHRHISSVIVIARRKSEKSWKEQMESLPVYICGGGRHSQWHRDTIERTYSCHQHAAVGIPPYSCMDLEPPRDREFKFNGAKDYGRYLVAFGLSIPKGTYPDPVGFPRQNPVVEYRRYDTDSILDERMYELYGELL